MAEAFPSSLDAMRRPGFANTAESKRPVVHSTVAARMIRDVKADLRTGPSAGVAHALVGRSLTAIESRLVSVLVHEGRDAVDGHDVCLEVALLVRLRRTLGGQPSQLEHDVVLVDSLVEFAEDVPAVLADLQAGGKRRLSRLVEYTRELTAQLVALGGNGLEHKARLRRLRTQVDELPNPHEPKRLNALTREIVDVHRAVTKDLERRSPRPGASMLDRVMAKA